MALYTCAGCSESIPAHKARLHCEYCGDYDQCGNCAILKVYTGSHYMGHRTTLHRTSGYATASPVGGGGGGGAGNPPHPAWDTMFDMRTLEAGPSFVDLASAIFDCMDSEGTGLVTPEALSYMLDLVELPIDENIWRRALAGAAGAPDKIQEADVILRRSYDYFAFEYELRRRRLATNGGETSQMACLTRRGFIRLWKMDTLNSPGRFCDYANLIFQNYQPAVWRERGDVPRRAFPEHAVTYEVQKQQEEQQEQALLHHAKANQPPGASHSRVPRRPDAAAAASSSPWPPSGWGGGWTGALPYGLPKQRQHASADQAAASAAAALEAQQALELQRAQAELDEMQRSKDRSLAHLERRHELEYTRARQRMLEDAHASMEERTRDVMNEIGQDRDYVIERWRR